jgi:hypothetical protein
MVVGWRLVVGLSSRRPGFSPGSVYVGFVVDKVALGQVFPRVIRFSHVNFIPPVLHYKEKRKKQSSSLQGLQNKPQGCGESVASAAWPFTKKKCLCGNAVISVRNASSERVTVGYLVNNYNYLE